LTAGVEKLHRALKMARKLRDYIADNNIRYELNLVGKGNIADRLVGTWNVQQPWRGELPQFESSVTAQGNVPVDVEIGEEALPALSR
jgi:hypothetical protein